MLVLVGSFSFHVETRRWNELTIKDPTTVPLPRFSAQTAIIGNMLYMYVRVRARVTRETAQQQYTCARISSYGGQVEVNNKECTFDDLLCLDLSKLQGYTTIIASTHCTPFLCCFPGSPVCAANLLGLLAVDQLEADGDDNEDDESDEGEEDDDDEDENETKAAPAVAAKASRDGSDGDSSDESDDDTAAASATTATPTSSSNKKKKEAKLLAKKLAADKKAAKADKKKPAAAEPAAAEPAPATASTPAAVGAATLDGASAALPVVVVEAATPLVDAESSPTPQAPATIEQEQEVTESWDED